MPLPAEVINQLLKDDKTRRTFDKATAIPQNGPLRWYDYTMRCTSLGCNSPTYCKVEGAPKCLMHALKELNQIAINVTELREHALKV